MDAIHHLLGGDRETCPQLDVPDAGLLHTHEDALSKQGGRPRQKCQWRQNKDVLAVFNEPVHWSWCCPSCGSASRLQ